MTRLALLAVVLALAPAAHAGTPPISCGSRSVGGTGVVAASRGGGATCLLAAFVSCSPASYELSLFGVDTIARTTFAVLRSRDGCFVAVRRSLRIVPGKPRSGGGGRCATIVRRSGDIVAAGCHGTGLDATISLIGRRR